MADPEKNLEPVVVDTNRLDWEERPREAVHASSYRKKLFDDPETGMNFHIRKYPAGFMVTKHVHQCTHGLYVLSGHLLTGGKVYGPGTFVWYPEGIVTDHGATATEDVICLFVTNKKFSIHYFE
jgi:hypothetical protein